MGAFAPPHKWSGEAVRRAAHLVETGRVRQQAVREVVLATVRVRVGVDGAFEQAEPQGVITHAVAMFAICKQRHAVVSIGQVGPALGGYFEGGCFPTRILVSRSVDRSELDFVCGASVSDAGRKTNFEQ